MPLHKFTCNNSSILHRAVHNVVTRSQSSRNKSQDFETMSDSENDHSVPEVLSRVQMVGILDKNRNFDNNRIEQGVLRHEWTTWRLS